jgi:hypothetical protein
MKARSASSSTKGLPVSGSHSTRDSAVPSSGRFQPHCAQRSGPRDALAVGKVRIAADASACDGSSLVSVQLNWLPIGRPLRFPRRALTVREEAATAADGRP